MKKEMKSKTALLCGLLVLGLTLVGVGSAFGAGAAFQGDADVVGAKLVNDTIEISRNDHVIEILTLPEGKDGFSMEIVADSGGQLIYIGCLTEVELEEHRAEHQMQLDGWLEIAEKDSRVQEIIDGKEYNVVASGQSFGPEGSTAFLLFDVEGEYYKVTIDLDSETVKSVEEQDSGDGSIYIKDYVSEG